MLTELKPLYPVELIVRGRSHFYACGGEEYPGVTGILDVIGGRKTHGLKKWAANVALANVEKELMAIGPEPVVMDLPRIREIVEAARKRPAEVLDQAADYGTKAHGYFDKVVKGLPLGDLPDEIENSVLGFNDFYGASGIEMVMGDTPVASKEHRYGGKLDGVGIRDGRYGILDWKTSNGVYETYALQVGAYALAFLETYGIKPGWGLIVRFGKTTPDYEACWLNDVDASARAFLAAKKLKDLLEMEHFA